MFTSEYSHSIDAKGRIVLPAKFREELGEKFYIAKGNLLDAADRMLCVYPEEKWLEYAQKLAAVPASDKIARKYASSLLAGATLCEPDKNGRTPIPDKLRQYASLDKDVISVGQYDHIEIWDKSRWEAYNDDVFNEEELAASLSKYGL